MKNSNKMVCRTVSGRSGAADLQEARFRTCGGIELVAVFDKNRCKDIFWLGRGIQHKDAPCFPDALSGLRCQLWMEKIKLLFDQSVVQGENCVLEALASGA
jgi:hypothetical protein